MVRAGEIRLLIGRGQGRLGLRLDRGFGVRRDGRMVLHQAVYLVR